MAKFKIAKIVLLVLVAIFVANALLEKSYSSSRMQFGVTFSPVYAEYLKLDWRKTYVSMLDDLKVRNLRVPTYWDKLEPKPGQLDFQDTDYMISEAVKRNVKVILVVGEKQPRWPECYTPDWAKSLSAKDRQQKVLEFIGQVVDRYRDSPAIWAWQVENEPLLAFGECEATSEDFLKQEVELVRSLSKKVIIMTDSGELGLWVTSARLSDIFGATLYRQVYDKWLGYVTYPLPPYYYNLKSNLVRNIFAKNNQKTIIVELQAEPWLSEGILRSPDEQAKIFTLTDLKEYTDYAKKTGFEEAYLWGVEWWYFMAANNHPEYINSAKDLFK